MNTNDNNQKPTSQRTLMGASIALAIGVGIALGNTMDNLGAGLAIGIAIGIGLFMSNNRKQSK